jgi:hypothetical protein
VPRRWCGGWRDAKHARSGGGGSCGEVGGLFACGFGEHEEAVVERRPDLPDDLVDVSVGWNLAAAEGSFDEGAHEAGAAGPEPRAQLIDLEGAARSEHTRTNCLLTGPVSILRMDRAKSWRSPSKLPVSGTSAWSTAKSSTASMSSRSRPPQRR